MSHWICRIVKDCAENDGIREYIFPQVFTSNEIESIQQLGDCQKIVHGDAICFRIHKKGHYALNLFLTSNKILVVFENKHHPEAREDLETVFRGLPAHV